MERRQLLTTAAAALAAPASTGAATSSPRGLRILTVSGAIAKTNRGPLDPALDQLMVKHGARFERAFEFDSALLAQLPSVSIEPTLEYDARPHKLSGPLLSSVIEAAGVRASAPVILALRALDGYTVAISLVDARSYRMIVADKVDGHPMNIGGLGPLWAIYDADRVAAFKDKPLKDRFALCPWGLYAIDVKPA
ncbi:MAG: molybdopterin-dependent oxidoreductase [Burkholderiales bacterium]